MCRPALDRSCSLQQLGDILGLSAADYRESSRQCIAVAMYLTGCVMPQLSVVFQLALRFQYIRKHRWTLLFGKEEAAWWCSWKSASPSLELAILQTTWVLGAKTPKEVMLRDTQSPKAGCPPNTPPTSPQVEQVSVQMPWPLSSTQGGTPLWALLQELVELIPLHTDVNVTSLAVEMVGVGGGRCISHAPFIHSQPTTVTPGLKIYREKKNYTWIVLFCHCSLINTP